MIEWYYLVIISALLNGISQIIEKKLLKVEHSLAFSTTVTAGVALISLILIPFASVPANSAQWLSILAFSATLALSYWLAARLYRHGNISIAAPMYNVLPILFVVIGAFIFLSEVLTIGNYAAILVIVAAAYLMFSEVNKIKKSEHTIKMYKRLIFAATLITAANLIILKYALLSINIYTLLIVTSILTAVFLFFEILGKSSAYREKMISAIRGNATTLIFMAVLTVSYRVLFYLAVSGAAISLATPLNSAIVLVLTVVPSGIMFGEKRLRQKILLSAIMLIAMYFLIAA